MKIQAAVATRLCLRSRFVLSIENLVRGDAVVPDAAAQQEGPSVALGVSLVVLGVKPYWRGGLHQRLA